MATADPEGIQLHQYATGAVEHRLSDEHTIALSITTDYPKDGTIRVEVSSEGDALWTLSMRVPAWAVDGATFSVNNEERQVQPGVVTETRIWQRGDFVVLHLPMHPRFTYPDSRVDAVRGCVAVERGPLVMALESVDLPADIALEEVRVDTSQLPRVVSGRVTIACAWVPAHDTSWPYQSASVAPEPESRTLAQVPLIEYHRWANRGPSTMRVWIPTL